MADRFEVSELEDVAELLELVEEGAGKATVTMGGTDRFVVMTAERYRALSDGYARERERAKEAAEALEAAEASMARMREDAAAANRAVADADAAAEVGAPAPRGAAARIASDAGEPYRLAQLPFTPIDSDDYQRSSYQDAIVDRMRKVIDAEAPIEKQRLFNTVRASFGIKRSGRDIQAHNDWLFGRNLNAKQTRFNDATFVWRADQDPEAYGTFRVADEEAGRQIAEICFQELKAAIIEALRCSERLSRDELIESAMRLLGYKRKTARVKEVLGAAIEQASDEGAIRIFTDGTFRAA